MSTAPSAGRVRSKTGCLTCKNRRKKCDETRPLCERCKKAGMTCLGYSYLEDSGDKALKLRSKAAARVSVAKSAATTLGKHDSPRPGPSRSRPPVVPLTPSPAAVTSPPMPTRTSLLPLIPGVARDNMPPTFTQAASETTPGGFPMFNSVFDFSFLSSLQSDTTFNPGLGDTTEWNAIFPPGEVGDSNSAQHPEACLNPAYGTQLDQQLAWGSSGLSEINQTVAPSARPGPSLDQPTSMTTGQASLFNALLSLGQPSTEPILPTPAPSTSLTTSPSSTWPSPDVEMDDSDSETSEDSDPEGIREIICNTPTLDATVQSNSLPFVLQSYAQWVSRTVYEPLRLAYKVRHWVTLRYNQSEDTRTSITMFAGLLNALWKKDASTSEYSPLISTIGERVRNRVIQATSSLSLAVASNVETAGAVDEATRALDEAMEMVAVQIVSAPMRTAMGLFIESASLFRIACPEPPHEPLINLPGLFVHPDLNLRHFAAIDVVVGTTLARPMLFRYGVHYDPALCDGIMDTEGVGLQWLNGIPDQIVLLLARMNMLRDDFAPNLDPGIIQDIERELREFTSKPGVSTDAYLMIARLAVQECWRLATYVYLYMGLCGANSTDARVQKYTKSFIRLLERTKPGRTPDSFLIGPLILIGVAAHRQRDRTLIQRRLLSIRECSSRGTTGNDAVHMLEDIWARTGAEGRPVTWNDHKVAASRVL